MYLRSARNKAAYFDSLSTVSEQKRRVINASPYLLSGVDRSFAPGWFNASALRAISRERQAILEQRTDEENGFGDTPNNPTVDKAGLEYNLFFS